QHTRDVSSQRPGYSFQKGGGMGGLTLIAKAAPVEIGNRTWFDLNADGIQDAGEPSIVGAVVELYAADENGNPTGEAIDTKTTDSNGNYFFRSEDAPEGGSEGFTREGNYVVVFSAPADDAEVDLNWNGATV